MTEQHGRRRVSPPYWLGPGILGLVLLWLVSQASLSADELNGWSPAQNLSSSPDQSRSAQLARDPRTGDLHVVWVEGNSDNEEILGRRWLAHVPAWGPVENLSNFGWRDQTPALLFDRQGQGHLLWTRRYDPVLGAPLTGTDLMWRHWDGAAWSDEQSILHIDRYLPSTYNSVLAETADSILLFVVWSGGYRLTEFRDGAWSELGPWDYGTGMSISQVLVDQEGAWHAAGFGPDSSDDWFYDAYYMVHDGTTWSEPANLSFLDGVAHSVSMAFDAQDRLHFLWFDQGSPFAADSQKSAIWERVLDNGAWTPNAEVTTYNDGQAINGFSLTTGEDHALHLAWSEGILVNGIQTDLNLTYQTGDGTTWFGKQEIYSSAMMSRTPILAVHGTDAWVVWEEAVAEPDLRDILIMRRPPPLEICCRWYLPLVGKNH